MRKKARGRKEGMRRCKVCGHKLDGQERVVPVVSLQALKKVFSEWKEAAKIAPKKENCPQEVWDFTMQAILNFIKELESWTEKEAKSEGGKEK